MSHLPFIQVTTTTATEGDARRIAASLVEQRMAACVQIEGPLESLYWWQGQVEQAREWRCTIKTRGSLFEAVTEAISCLHPYDCPRDTRHADCRVQPGLSSLAGGANATFPQILTRSASEATRYGNFLASASG